MRDERYVRAPTTCYFLTTPQAFHATSSWLETRNGRQHRTLRANVKSTGYGRMDVGRTRTNRSKSESSDLRRVTTIFWCRPLARNIRLMMAGGSFEPPSSQGEFLMPCLVYCFLVDVCMFAWQMDRSAPARTMRCTFSWLVIAARSCRPRALSDWSQRLFFHSLA